MSHDSRKELLTDAKRWVEQEKVWGDSLYGSKSEERRAKSENLPQPKSPAATPSLIAPRSSPATGEKATALKALYEKYKDRGLKILAFPANNFGAQEPGTDAEIKTFCTTRYNVSFDLFSKISVKGDDKAPLYRFLTEGEKDPGLNGEIKWNFQKFLVTRRGEVVARFEPADDPLSPKVTEAVEKALRASGNSTST